MNLRLHTPLRAPLVAAALAAAAVPAGAGAQRATVEGLVVDATERRPVAEAVVMLAGTSHSGLTRADGNFRLEGVAAGRYTLRVRHVAYGEHTETLEVGAGETVRLRIAVSAEAIALEPIEVQARSLAEQAARGSGARLNVVTRAQIAAHVGTGLSLADVLRQHVAGVRVRHRENLVGQPVCIEFRTFTGPGRCRSPAVYLDGVRITNPTFLYGVMDLRTIESMQVVPAAEAGVRFGPGALNGALLIESRRPGTDDEGRTTYVERSGFDWSLEPAPHARTRVFVSSLAGASAGLALGLAAASQCIGLRSPTRDSIVTECDGLPTLGAAAAAMVLPALGGALAARIAGRTERSQGRLLPAAAGAGMALLPGYAALLSGQRSGSDFLEWTGRTILVLGVPFAVTVADRLFRTLH